MRNRLVGFMCLLTLASATTAQTSSTWTGSLSSTWTDTANWTNGVPSATVDAIIPLVSTPPSTLGVAASCRALTVQSGAFLDVVGGFPLQVHGGANVQGPITGNGLVQFVGTGTITTASNTPLPRVDLLNIGSDPIYTIVDATISGVFRQLAGTITFQNAVTMNRSALFQGATVAGGSNLTVAGDVTFATTSPVTGPPLNIIFRGTTWTSNANFTPGGTSQAVQFESPTPAGPQTLVSNGSVFARLLIEGPTDVTVTTNLAVSADLEVRFGGQLTSLGSLLEVGRVLSVDTLLRSSSVTSLRVAFNSPLAGLAVGGSAGTALDMPAAALDVRGDFTVSGLASARLGPGPHTISDGCNIAGQLIVPASSSFIFDGAGQANPKVIQAARIPCNVDITAGTHQLQCTISGSFRQLAGTIALGPGAVIDGPALFQGITVTGLSSLDFNSDVTWATSGMVTSPAQQINVAGNWTSNARFAPTQGTIIFDGTGPQTITTVGTPGFRAFNLTVAAGPTVSTTSLLFVAQDLAVNGSLGTTATVGVARNTTLGPIGILNPGPSTSTFSGNFAGNNSGRVLGNGTCLFDNPATIVGVAQMPNVAIDPSSGVMAISGTVNVNGNLTLASGTLRTTDSSTTLHVLGNAVFAGGSLAQLSGGVLDVDGDVTFSGTSGSAPPLIRCGGNWTSDSLFRPQSGTVELDGTGTTTISGRASGFDPVFRNLVLKNGVRLAGNNFTFTNPTTGVNVDIRIDAGSEFGLNGRQVGFRCAGMSILGRFSGSAGSVALLDGPTTFALDPIGTLELNGTAAMPVRFGALTGGNYNLSLGGRIEAQNYVFENMSASGVRILASATIGAPPLDLRGGVFRHTAATAGSVLLDIARTSPMELWYPTFDKSPALGFNVRSLTNARILIRNHGGNYSGPAFEHDPNNIIDWTSGTILGGFQAGSQIGRIRLSFDTTSEDQVRFYRLSRALNPNGPFTEITGSPITPTGNRTTGAVYGLTDTAVAFPTKYYYRLEEEALAGPRTVLATAFARPWPPAVGATAFVGPGGFADIGAALASVPAPSNVLVAAGTYPPFTLTRPARILADGSGTVTIDTSAAPLVIRDIPGVPGDTSLYGLRIAGMFGLQVINCDNVTVLDGLTVTGVGTGIAGIRIDDCPRVAVQTCTLTGDPGLRVRTASNVYLSLGSLDHLIAELSSRVTRAGVTPGNTTIDGSSQVVPLSGTMPALTFAQVAPGERQTRLRFTADPNTLFVGFLAFQKSYLDLSLFGMRIDMVLLLDFGQLVTLVSGFVPATGVTESSLPIPDQPSLWGFSLPLQFTSVALSGAGRFGGVRDLVIVP